MQMFFGNLRRRVAGLALLALGAFALTAPLLVGRWSLAILGIPLIALSLAEAYAAFTSSPRPELSAHIQRARAMCAGGLLLLSSALVLGGLVILLLVILATHGLSK